jgi:CBS domain-containing protein
MAKDVLTVDAGDNVMTAACRMRDGNVGLLPICDDAGKVIGVLTDRDIALRVDAEGRSASDCRVGDVMTTPVVSCRPTDDLAKAEDLMNEHRISRIVVTDEDGVLSGVVSLSDVVQFEGVRRTATVVRRVMSRETRF